MSVLAVLAGHALPLATADAEPRHALSRAAARKPVRRIRTARPQPDSARAPVKAVPAAAPPPAPSPAPPLFWRIRPAVGCAHPDEYGLTGQERARCAELLSDLARAAPSFGSDVPPAKAAAYAKSLRCRRIVETETGPEEGVINGASLRACPPGEH